MPQVRTVISNSSLQSLVNGRTVPADPMPTGKVVKTIDDVFVGLGLPRDIETVLRQRLTAWSTSSTPTDAHGSMLHDLRGALPDDPYRRQEIMRRALQYIQTQMATGPQRWPVVRMKSFLVAMMVDPLEKGAGHKYFKRELTGRAKPKYRYYYYIPKRGVIVSGEKLHEGTKIKGEHEGHEGHWEVMKHDQGQGNVTIRHDETGHTTSIGEEGLRGMINQYHEKRGTKDVIAKQRAERAGKRARGEKQERPKEEKPELTPRADVKDISLDELGKGGWEEIVGFSPDRQSAAKLAATRPGHEVAVVAQPNGFLVAARKPRSAEPQKELQGDHTKVFMRDKTGAGIRELDAQYAVVEADDLIASHDPLTMAPRKDYPTGVQERRYHELVGEQMKVHKIGQTIRPEIVINTNPDGVNGTPVVTEDNVVLGGNGRTMAQQLAYAQHPESAARLRTYLMSQAKNFGLSTADVQAMKHPILVRKVQAGKETDKLRMLGRRLNESLTKGLDPRTAEVAIGKNFVNHELVGALTTDMEPDQSLASYLHNPKSAGFVKALERSGIIDEMNRDEFVDPETGLLNEDGRLRVERVLAARMIPDATLLSKMNQETRGNIAKSVPYMLRAEAAGWDIRGALEAAVRGDIAFRAQSQIKTHEDYFDKQTVNETLDPNHPALTIQKDNVARALLQVLDEYNGPNKMAAGFREFARRAEAAREVAGGSLFGGEEKETPDVALDRSFGLSQISKRAISENKKRAKVEQAQLEATFGITEAMKKKGKGTTTEEVPEDGPPPVAAGQEAMFASIMRSSLHKSKPGAMFIDAVVRELRRLMDAERSAAALEERDVDTDKVRMRLGEAMAYAVGADPQLAESARAAKLTSEQVTGLIGALGQVKTEKGFANLTDLIKAEQLGLFDRPARKTEKTEKPTVGQAATTNKPPGAGWESIPHGRHGGFRKKNPSGGWGYWYPDKGMTGKPHEGEPKEVHEAHERAKPEDNRRTSIEGPEPAGDMITSGEGRLWRVRDRSGGKIAYILLQRQTPSAPWYVGQVYVDEKHRRQGIATELHDRAAAWAEDKGGLGSGMITGEGPRPMWEKWVQQGIAVREPDGRYRRIKPDDAKPQPKLVVTPEKVKETVSQEKEADRKFETAGKKIGGSRADLASMKMEDLEKNPTLARTLVTKANVLGTWKADWAAMDREAGVEPAAAFAKKEILDSVAGKPYDHPDIRDHYRRGASILLSGLARCKTIDDVHDLSDHRKAVGATIDELVNILRKHNHFEKAFSAARLIVTRAFIGE